MFKLIRSYIFWTYERGSFHYDIMVTAILLFMFVSPHFIELQRQAGRNRRPARKRSARERSRHHLDRKQPLHVPDPRRRYGRGGD